MIFSRIRPPIKLLGNDPDLDNEVAQVLGLDLASLFPRQRSAERRESATKPRKGARRGVGE
jgi:hypothetical protein